MSLSIPQPPAYPIIGNIGDIDPQNGMQSLIHLAEKYGPIFKLSFFGSERVFIGSVKLLNEVCDESRFCKSVVGPLKEIRNGTHDGLFTAHQGEHAWEVAHRTLVPAFGPIGIHNMFDEMYDIATQLVAKWARDGPEEAIDVVSDYTRLTLDSIALCAMDKRFNSFYKEDLHPFVGAMVDFLVESGRRNRRTRIESFLNKAPERQYFKDIETMRSVAAEVIARRKANPSDKKDLLNALLFGKDPKTGERLTEQSVMDNMITFLIAGHETTSGLLSFTTYFLLKNPEALQKAQQEVDQVVGRRPITFKDMSNLPYIEACLRESLRLWPTAPAFTLTPVPGTTGPVIIGGEYQILPDQPIVVVLPAIGRDHEVYGPDANEYKPDRMYGENFTKLPPNAWKPFGNGVRGCIGRPFAWQEAVLALSMILQNFNLRLDDPSYQLRIKQTLTLKPEGLFIKASLRDGIDPIKLQRALYTAEVTEHAVERTPAQPATGQDTKPIAIYYGSNSGTCEGLSHSLAGTALSHGYNATVQPLDNAVGKLPVGQPVIIITSSYEGQPPDNAAHFVQWLKSADPSKLQGVKFAVFGCGHHDWVSTYQRIPALIDTSLSEHGASQIVTRGETDVAQGKIFDDFDDWQDNSLWPALTGTPQGELTEVNVLDVDISTQMRASNLRHTVQEALVIKNELLTPPGVPEKRHLEFTLPTDMTYEAGDYLAILPLNPIETVGRVLRKFGLPWDTMMTIKKGSQTSIPAGTPLSVTIVLAAYFELSGPPSRKNLATIAQYAPNTSLTYPQTGPSTNPAHQPSILEILEANPSVQLPFSVYLSMLTPMRIRQYSISSSPLADPTTASITISVIDDRNPEHPYLGVATNYLRGLKPGSTVHLAVKKSHPTFHLPLADTETPVIMIAAGTGLAPFRGFVQERATKIAAAKSSGRDAELAEAVLFIGCRSPDQDLLYKSLFDEWETLGAVKVFPAFSQKPDESAGCKYAQDRLYAERELVTTLFNKGARSYICGSARLGDGVADAVARIMVEIQEKKGNPKTYEQALKWWQDLRGERFAVDVFE